MPHKAWWGVKAPLPSWQGEEIKTEKALLARKMSLKAAAKHLMGFIYLQLPSDLGWHPPCWCAFFWWDTHLAFRKMTPPCIFCDGGEGTFVTGDVKSGGEMLPLCLATVRYLQSDHMTGAALAKSHGHCLQARCKGHARPCCDGARMTAALGQPGLFRGLRQRCTSSTYLHCTANLLLAAFAWQGCSLQRAMLACVFT